MTERDYLERRAAQEIGLASGATDRRAAAAHDAMAAAYFRELARLEELEAVKSNCARRFSSD
jgi:hypothetical protein